MGLVTNPKNVKVKEVNRGGVLHTHQQEEPMNLGGRLLHKNLNIRRQMPTVGDNIRHGYMKSIKQVLEVPTSQSGARHATMLVTLLHIVI